MTPDQANVVTQVTALNTAIAAAGKLNNASLATLAPLILQAQTASSAIDQAILSTDALILSSPASGVAGITAGGYAPTLAATLMAQLTDIQNQVKLLALKGAVGRVLVNLQQATG